MAVAGLPATREKKVYAMTCACENLIHGSSASHGCQIAFKSESHPWKFTGSAGYMERGVVYEKNEDPINLQV